jgi:SAM-dependent methyltransferase
MGTSATEGPSETRHFFAMTATDKHWERWGATDPYYGVITHEEFRSSRLSDDALDRFFQLGEEHVSKVLATIRKHARSDFAPTRAIDFGCGTGRLVIPLSRRCPVVGVDVSPSMLREAEKNAASRLARDVEFAESIPDQRFDLVHSYIVFQHIPVKRGMALTRQLLGTLSPDGIAVLHYTYATRASAARKTINWARHTVPFAHNLLNVVQGRPVLEPPMQMNRYSVNALLKLFLGVGLQRAHLQHTDHGGHLGVIFYLWR